VIAWNNRTVRAEGSVIVTHLPYGVTVLQLIDKLINMKLGAKKPGSEGSRCYWISPRMGSREDCLTLASFE
jgi:hypothetical protein